MSGHNIHIGMAQFSTFSSNEFVRVLSSFVVSGIDFCSKHIGSPANHRVAFCAHRIDVPLLYQLYIFHIQIRGLCLVSENSQQMEIYLKSVYETNGYLKRKITLMSVIYILISMFDSSSLDSSSWSLFSKSKLFIDSSFSDISCDSG